MGVPQSLDRKREEDEQKNYQKCLKFRGDLAEGKRNVQHQKHRSALRALKNKKQKKEKKQKKKKQDQSFRI